MAEKKRGREESLPTEPPPLKKRRDDGAQDAPVRVYCDGVFDLFHFGHARALKQAKELMPHTTVVAGVCSDDTVRKYRGGTIFTQEERYECVRACKWADEVIEDAPWYVDEEFLEKHKIDYVVHGRGWMHDASGRELYETAKKIGKFKAIQRTEGISSREILLRIIKNFDRFVQDTLALSSREDLRLGPVRAMRFRLQKQIRQLEGIIKSKLDEQREGLLQAWRSIKVFFMKDYLADYASDDDDSLDAALAASPSQP
mmetsp:Transcript_9500/g.23774  ORF Transcript_9500/g.23774 Transcript_9500/m.23774 type:complete len:257 (-) Transcript_9500:438-1208(-)